MTLAGLGTAIYLERTRDSMGTPSPAAETPNATILSAAIVSPTDSHDPLAASAAVPTRDSPERHGSTSLPTATAPQTQIAMLEPPVAAAPSPSPSTDGAEPTHAAALDDAASPDTPYWVEYGVYNGARGAKRLQQALADHGLDTVVVPTHAPDGRPLLRVRSSLILDRAAAKAASENARQALKLSTLIHRGAAAPAPAQTVAHALVPSASPQGYWVQFGAFPHRPQAARLQEQLARSGIETAVSTMLGTSGRTLYRVRSLALPDRDSALAIAGRGQEAASGNFLVGQSIAHPAPGAERRTEDGSARRSIRYSAVGSPPFPAR